MDYVQPLRKYLEVMAVDLSDRTLIVENREYLMILEPNYIVGDATADSSQQKMPKAANATSRRHSPLKGDALAWRMEGIANGA